MLRTRWRKVLHDLADNLPRTVLVIAAIAVGVFAVGLITSGQSILLRELDRNYAALNAASATVYTEPFDGQMVESMARIPDVAVAAGRRTVRVRANVGPDEWQDLVLTAVADYDDIQLDKFVPESGKWPPEKGDVLVERLSLDYIGSQPGDSLLIELPDGTQKELNVVGSVYDNSVPDAQIIDRAFGYVTIDTIEWLGLGRFYTELRFTVAENETDLAHIQAVSEAVEDKLARSGREVLWVDIPPPGEHWAKEIIETLVLLMGVFGVLTLFLSGFLVVNTISALLSQHVKQIGVMKLVGARRRQIVGMYFILVLVYGLLALGIGMPPGILVAQYLVSDFVANLLNFKVFSLSVPPSVIAIQVAVALLVPLLAALWPVISGVQITTHKALNSLGVGQGGYGKGLIDRLFVKVQEVTPVQRPLIISLRNTMRRKGRLALTLITLILGTALFISVLSVRISVQQTIADFLRFHQYDASVSFSRPYRVAQIERLARQVPGVVAVESWTTNTVRRIRPDESNGDSVNLWAVPAVTPLMAPQIEDGRWLEPQDSNALVINTDFTDAEPDVEIGDEIWLDIDGREEPWQIVGLVRSTANGAAVYANNDYYTYITSSVGEATSVRVITERHDAAYQEDVAVRLAEQFQDAGVRVSNTNTTESIRETNQFRFNIVVAFLVLMAVLMAAVGSLGLTTTMSINVLERIREIGVLRAIGASDGAVRQIVLAEGVVIGMLSWSVGSLLAVPMSMMLSEQVGLALLGSPLSYTFSLGGTFLWLLIVGFLSVAASLGPARSASRLTIREVLAYE